MDEIITSRHNSTLKKICRLKDRKYRESEKLFRFDGVKLCAEAIGAGAELVYILLRRGSADYIIHRIYELCGKRLNDTGACILYLEDSLFDSVSEEKSPEGIISVAKYIDKIHKVATIYSNSGFPDIPSDRIMMLFDIKDPGNMGTIMRSAAAFGIDTLILCGECADIYSSKTLRGSMGAMFRIKTLRVSDGIEMIKYLRHAGRRVLAAALDSNAVPVGDAGLDSNDCIVIGNEGHGLTEQVISCCDGCVIIPMCAGSESLNAAVAAAIFMWETREIH